MALIGANLYVWIALALLLLLPVGAGTPPLDRRADPPAKATVSS